MSQNPAASHILLTTDAIGGVWTYSLALAEALATAGLRISLAVLGPAEPSHIELPARPNVTVIKTDLPLDWLVAGTSDLSAITRALRDIAQSLAPDVIHLHAPALAGASPWPAPLVVTAHSCVATWWRAVKAGPVDHHLAWHVEATSTGLRNADMTIAPSRSFLECLQTTYEAPRSVAVRNGLPAPAHICKPQRARTRILAAGRLWDAAKDVPCIDDAAGRSQLIVHVAGSTMGPHGEHIVLRNARHIGNLSRDTLSSTLADTALFISTSIYEPFGLAVLEAALHGAALILSDIPTHRELWSDAALFVPPRRPDLLQRAIEATYADLPLRESLAAAARSRARRYSAARMAQGTLLAYAHAERRFRRGRELSEHHSFHEARPS